MFRKNILIGILLGLILNVVFLYLIPMWREYEQRVRYEWSKTESARLERELEVRECNARIQKRDEQARLRGEPVYITFDECYSPQIPIHRKEYPQLLLEALPFKSPLRGPDYNGEWEIVDTLHIVVNIIFLFAISFLLIFFLTQFYYRLILRKDQPK